MTEITQNAPHATEPSLSSQVDLPQLGDMEKTSATSPGLQTGEQERLNVNGTMGVGQILEIATVIDRHPAHPRNWSLMKKWSVLSAYCMLQLFITMTSTAYVGVEFDISEEFNVSTQVVTLGQSLYIIGQAIGPLLLGPMSDLGGRKWVYVVSIFIFALFSIACALAHNMAQLAICQFVCGVIGSTAVTNVAGSVSDLFSPAHAGQAMALFVLSANYGPSIGSPVGELIVENVNMGWRWLFWLNVIIGMGFAVAMIFLPETLPSVVIAKYAKGKNDPDAEMVREARAQLNVGRDIRFITTMAFKILLTEPIVIALGLSNGFAYGLLFLYLTGVFPVFNVNYGLSYLGADLTYLNFAVSVTIMFILYPIQNWFYLRDIKKHGGKARPEARFITSLVTIWFFPISLLWAGFTSDGTNTSFWSPVIAGCFLGLADPLVWLSMLNYITDSYPSTSASAIAAFTLPSFAIAGALAHAGVALFANVSTTWSFAMLGFISFGLVAIVYGLYFFGHSLRKRSKLAASFTS